MEEAGGEPVCGDGGEHGEERVGEYGDEGAFVRVVEGASVEDGMVWITCWWYRCGVHDGDLQKLACSRFPKVRLSAAAHARDLSRSVA